MADTMAATSPRRTARIAGVFYLGTFLMGGYALAAARGSMASLAANNLSTGCYVGVTVLFYELFKPVSRNLSLLAAIFSFVGLATSTLSVFHLDPIGVSGLVFFGVYCVLIGYLIINSTFLPHILGVLMAIGGLSWLTFASPALAKSLAPFNFAPGIIAEGALTAWLLVKGVNEQRWKEQANT